MFLVPFLDQTVSLSKWSACQNRGVLVVHSSARLLPRLGQTAVAAGEVSTTALGSWYATIVPWRPQVALLVNQLTLLPVLMPLAPAKSLLERFPSACGEVMKSLQLPKQFVDHELAEMKECLVARVASRRVIGSANEFIGLADAFADSRRPDLHALSLRLAHVPCGPLFSRSGFPDTEVAALAAAFMN